VNKEVVPRHYLFGIGYIDPGGNARDDVVRKQSNFAILSKHRQQADLFKITKRRSIPKTIYV
jgi:hypothetical protein